MTTILEIFAIWCAASIGYGVLTIIKPLPARRRCAVKTATPTRPFVANK